MGVYKILPVDIFHFGVGNPSGRSEWGRCRRCPHYFSRLHVVVNVLRKGVENKEKLRSYKKNEENEEREEK